VVTFLTTSSTAYVGIFIIGLTLLGLFSVTRILKPRYFIGPLAVLGIGALLYATVPLARQVLDTTLFAKAASYSTLERLMTISNSYQVFLQHPLLGIGWMSITSHDLIVNILANAGILGLLSFAIAMYSIFRPLYRSIKSRDRTRQIAGLMRMDLALYVALAVTLATSVVSGFLNVFTFFWFLLGLAIATSGVLDVSETSAIARSAEHASKNVIEPRSLIT
jgi:O-antigen ligase